MAEAASPLAAVAGGIRVRVKLAPKASRAAVGGVFVDAAGTAFLKVAVTAAPEDGKANAALVALLAKAWRLPKSAIAVVAGATERRKTLLIAGNPAELMKYLSAMLCPPSGGTA